MPSEAFILLLAALVLFVPVAYRVVYSFKRVRVNFDLLKMLHFEIEAERDSTPPDDTLPTERKTVT